MLLLLKIKSYLTINLINLLIWFVAQEEKNKGKVHDIDVWDEAHKKKDARMKEVLVYCFSCKLHLEILFDS